MWADKSHRISGRRNYKEKEAETGYQKYKLKAVNPH